MPHSETYVDGVWFPSVTTVMGIKPKPWLETWHEKWKATATRESLSKRKVKIANAIGTVFHDCIDQYLTRGYWAANIPNYPSCEKRINGMMKSFEDWAVSIEGEVHATELKVISRLYTYSGTLDAVGTLNGKPIIYDWKTSSHIYDDMALQLSAYSQAYKEERGLDIKAGLIVHVSKDKPRFKLTTKIFKLGKRVLNKFLKLRKMFDDMRGPNEETTVEQTSSGASA